MNKNANFFLLSMLKRNNKKKLISHANSAREKIALKWSLMEVRTDTLRREKDEGWQKGKTCFSTFTSWKVFRKLFKPHVRSRIKTKIVKTWKVFFLLLWKNRTLYLIPNSFMFTLFLLVVSKKGAWKERKREEDSKEGKFLLLWIKMS